MAHQELGAKMLKRIETDLLVIKKDNRREKFSREKVKTGILKSIYLP